MDPVNEAQLEALAYAEVYAYYAADTDGRTSVGERLPSVEIQNTTAASNTFQYTVTFWNTEESELASPENKRTGIVKRKEAGSWQVEEESG